MRSHTKYQKKQNVLFITVFLITFMIGIFFVGYEADEESTDQNLQKKVTIRCKTSENANIDIALEPVSESVKIGIDMYAIEVDGKEMFYMETEKEAINVLMKLLGSYESNDKVDDQIMFQEDVKIIKVHRDIFDCAGFMSEEEVLELIFKGSKKLKIHKVAIGEYLLGIEQYYGLQLGELLDMNPDFDIHDFKIGTELKVIVSEPIINVISVSGQEHIESTSYEGLINSCIEDYH